MTLWVFDRIIQIFPTNCYFMVFSPAQVASFTVVLPFQLKLLCHPWFYPLFGQSCWKCPTFLHLKHFFSLLFVASPKFTFFLFYACVLIQRAHIISYGSLSVSIYISVINPVPAKPPCSFALENVAFYYAINLWIVAEIISLLLHISLNFLNIACIAWIQSCIGMGSPLLVAWYYGISSLAL